MKVTKTMKTRKRATRKVAAKKVAAKKAGEMKRDKYGFREGTNVSKLFAALMAGSTMEELKKITGAVTSKTIADFKKSPKENPRGRSAVIEKGDNNICKIKNYAAPLTA